MLMAELNDTHPDARAVQLQLLRSAPVWRKVEIMGQLNLEAQELALSGLRTRFPRAGQGELRRRLADLLLGVELAARVYGPGPGEPHDP